MSEIQRDKKLSIERARELWHNSSVPEQLLWSRLRNGSLAGLKFRRQHPLDCFILDFYCHAKRLVIELDGNSHIGRANYDRDRTVFLQEKGLSVIRFLNDVVIRDMDAVLTAILLACGIDPNRKAPSP